MNRDNDKGKILIGRTLVWVGVQFAMLLLIIVRRGEKSSTATAKFWPATGRIFRR